jgi:hypothetical protein
MFRLFSGKRDKEDWDTVYHTTDSWEAEVIRSALLSEDIRAKVKSTKGDGKNWQNTVLVPASRVTEAEMVIRRTSIVISNKEEILAEQKEREKLASQAAYEDHEDEQPITPETKPTGEPILLAEKDDVGKIFYYEEEDKYELRLEMEFYRNSHFMSGEEWEEFTDFSAQRQEFFILLKEKYPKLAALLKENKMRPSFLKLIEYSYGKSQPPKKKK